MLPDGGLPEGGLPDGGRLDGGLPPVEGSWLAVCAIAAPQRVIEMRLAAARDLFKVASSGRRAPAVLPPDGVPSIRCSPEG
jgi:hypothetical protein